MTLQVPWVVDGPQITSGMGRRAHYQATGGQEGVIRGSNLKVLPTGPASDSIIIGAGQGTVRNRSQGGGGQSYAFNNDGDVTVDVNPTGGSSRSDLVVVTIRDPEFSPWDPPPEGQEDDYDYAIFDIIYGVPNSTTTVDDLNGGAGLGYSAYALARIDRPSGTAIVSAGDIVDLRQLVAPRSFLYGQNVSAAGSDVLNAEPPMTWEHFPSSAHFPVAIPGWATQCFVSGFVDSIDVKHAGIGALCVGIDPGGYRSEVTNISLSGSGADRAMFVVGGTIDIPLEIRGTTQGFFCMGRIGDEGSNGFLQTTDTTNFNLFVAFMESTQ